MGPLRYDLTVPGKTSAALLLVESFSWLSVSFHTTGVRSARIRGRHAKLLALLSQQNSNVAGERVDRLMACFHGSRVLVHTCESFWGDVMTQVAFEVFVVIRSSVCAADAGNRVVRFANTLGCLDVSWSGLNWSGLNWTNWRSWPIAFSIGYVGDAG